jgi:primosomal protein N''
MHQQKPESTEADELRDRLKWWKEHTELLDKNWEALHDSSLIKRDALRVALTKVESERDVFRKETEELRGLLIRCREFAIEAIQDRIKISGVDPAKHGLVRMIDAATKPSPKEGP